MGPLTYQVGTASPYIGKSLNQINDLAIAGQAPGVNTFQPGDVAKWFGIDPNQALTAGQTVNLNAGGDYKLSDAQFRANQILSPVSPGQLEQQAVQPAVNALQASKQPLQDRYKALLDEIKGDQEIATNRQTVSSKNELARRGIVGGGYYDQQLVDTLNPVTNFYSGQIGQTTAQENQDISGIDTQIAQLLSGAGLQGIQNNFTQQQIAQNALNAKNTYDLQKQAQDFAQKYLTIPGYGIYNTLTQQLLGGLSGVQGNGISNGMVYIP